MNSTKRMGAMEGMFDPEQTAAELLDTVKANVASTVKTIDAAASLENKLSEEAAQFNTCLTTMSNAIRKCEQGEISRDEMLAECAPCVSALKEKCSALKLGNVKTTGDDITEDEIAMLREYIVGCKDIVAARKKELQDSPVEGASEGLMASLANFMPATEAANSANELRKSNEAKTANELYKQAKKLYGLGSKEQAMNYLKKAKKLYEGCLKKAEKLGNMITVERTVKGVNIEDKYNEKATKNVRMAYVIDYFEDRVDSCTALEMQWNNKAGNSTYAETKKQLKEERKEARKKARLDNRKKLAGKKAGMAANRSAKKYADKAYKAKMAAAENREEREAVESAFECMIATETFVDETFTEYDLFAAMESDGEESDAPTVSENEQKLRDLYAQFNEAKADGDEAKMNQLVGEIQKVISAIEKEAADAYTEDDLKAADRKLAKGLAIGAAVVAAAAAIGVGVKSGAFKAVAEKAKEQAGKLRKNKGDNKSETSKGKSILSNIKTALLGVKGKFKLGKKGGNTGDTSVLALPAPAGESMIDGMTYVEFEASMESLMDSIELDLAMGAAMEAEGDEEAEGVATSASSIGAKLRAAFAKLKKGKVENDSAAVAEAEREVKEATAELSDAADAAETPEEKSKVSKAIKIGLAAAATAAAAVGLAVVASKASKAADAKTDRGFELNKGEQLLRNAASAIKTAKGNASQMGGRISDSVKRAKQHMDNKRLANRFKKTAFGKVADESFLGTLCDEYALESFVEEYGDDDETEPMEGKSFDDDAQGTDMIEDANEALDEMATEAAIAVMMAEDGIDDSDLI